MNEHCYELERIFNLIERKRISIIDNNFIHHVFCKNIVRAEADGSYTHVFLSNSTKITMSGNIKNLQDKLPDCVFFRAHRSHIVNALHISKFDNTGNDIYMCNDKKLPLAKENKKAYKKHMKMLEG